MERCGAGETVARGTVARSLLKHACTEASETIPRLLGLRLAPRRILLDGCVLSEEVIGVFGVPSGGHARYGIAETRSGRACSRRCNQCEFLGRASSATHLDHRGQIDVSFA